MLRRLARWVQRRQLAPDSRRRIVVDADGLALHEGTQLVGVLRWSDVDEIAAYKSDDFTYDTIWLEFNLPSKGEVFAINDNNEGFWDVVRTVKQIFPDSLQEWEQRVVQPPFARNWTELYQRGGVGSTGPAQDAYK